MALTITRDELLALARLDAEIPGDATSGILNSEVETWIDQGIKRLTGIIIEANPNWEKKSGDISLVAGTEDYSLPADFYKKIHVEILEASHWYVLEEVPLHDRSRYQDGLAGLAGPVYYFKGDGTITVLPADTNGGDTVRVWYVPNAGALGSGAATFNGRAGWEEYVISYCGYKYHRRVGEDTSVWERDMFRLKKEIEVEASDMNKGRGTAIRNVEHDWLYARFPWRF